MGAAILNMHHGKKSEKKKKTPGACRTFPKRLSANFKMAAMNFIFQ
jgi:hypothetical protein